MEADNSQEHQRVLFPADVIDVDDSMDDGMDSGSSSGSMHLLPSKPLTSEIAATYDVLRELISAVHELQFRGLHVAAQWAAELAGSMTVFDILMSDIWVPPNHLAKCSIEEYNAITVATAHFNVKQYRRCVTTLKNVQNLHSICPGAFFLRYYSLYLAGEKRREEEEMEALDPVGKAGVTNRDLRKIFDVLTPLYRLRELDALGMYLYGIVLKGMELKNDARRVLVESLCEFPWNWSCCLDLIGLYDDFDSIPDNVRETLQLPQHWMSFFLEAALYMEYQKNEEAIPIYTMLQSTFPESTYILAQIALCWYNIRDYDRSVVVFEDIRKRDLYKLDLMDVYSNILFVREDANALSQLARQACQVDKFTPVTACIVGNYFGLRNEHEKAVTYFRRAISLNKNFFSAWILMGHEFTELKNTPLAIEAYRTAVNIKPREYRAWYGLGQTYELLNLHFFALDYYKHAVRLRDNDARMWHAMAVCYDALEGHKEDAIKSFERAHLLGDSEGLAARRLAKIHVELGNTQQAAAYYEEIINPASRPNELKMTQGLTADVVEALKFMIDHYRNTGNLDKCRQCAVRLQDTGGPDRNIGKTVLRELASAHKK
eukprot:GEMP01012425.1.p1 GENE.GEMP01012425.1~~GEMP01012425.1.p1  ORF type:complete len:602 (+),score=119.05 GEMP01012425.1:63-1868(+)